MLGWSVTWALKEFTKRSAESKGFILLFQERERARCREMHQHQHQHWGVGAASLLGNGVFVDQDVSVWPQLVSMLSLGAGSDCPVLVVSFVLFCKFPEPLCLQGISSNFLVLRIKAYKTIRVSHALWGPSSSRKESLRKWLLSYYSSLWFLRWIYSSWSGPVLVLVSSDKGLFFWNYFLCIMAIELPLPVDPGMGH